MTSKRRGNIGESDSQKTAGGQMPDAWNYEATVGKVEKIISQIESGELDLADVFDEFAAAVEYLGQCESFLATRQRQMNVLIENLADTESF